MKKLFPLLITLFIWTLSTAQDSCSVNIVSASDPVIGGVELIALTNNQTAQIFQWSTGDSTESIVVFAPGTYCVSVINADGCIADACFTYDGSDPDSLCLADIWQFYDSSGIILQAYLFNGWFPTTPDSLLDYTWSTGEITPVIVVDSAGEYCVTITGSGVCSAEACITISDNDCGLELFSYIPGALFVEAYGIPPFTILWNDGTTDPFIITTPGQEYCVTVTDALGCVTDTCMTVDSFINPIDSFCFVEIWPEVDSNGQLTLVAQAWNSWVIPGNFSYVWNTGDSGNILIPTINQEYCVTATSSSGCTVVTCIDLGSVNCDLGFTCDPLGTLTVLPSGFPPFNILWDDGSTDPTIPVVEGQTYCVTVTDALGCVIDSCMTVDSFINPIDSFCFVEIWPEVDSNGQLTLIAQAWSFWGIPGSFSYVWNTGDTGNVISVNANQEYCVTATSTNGCSVTACIDLDSMSCDLYLNCDPFGMLTVFPIGIPPFSIQWDNGSTDASIPVVAGQQYCVTVTDATGCISDTCMIVDSIINPVDSFCVVEIWPEVNTNGQLTLVAQAWSFWGIPGNFSYVWNTGDSGNIIIPTINQAYCVTATSPDGCIATACIDLSNTPCDIDAYVSAAGILQLYPTGIPPFTFVWDTGDSTMNIPVVSGQTYCVTVTDAVSCVVDTCITIDSIPVDSSCWVSIFPTYLGNNEFELNAYSQGLTDPLTYSWSDGSTGSSIIVPAGSGFYCVTVTNANGCTSTSCIDMSVVECLTLEIDVDEVNNGYELTATIVNTQNYTFLWSTGDTTQTIFVDQDGLYCVDVFSLVDSCFNSACVLVGDSYGSIYGDIMLSDSNNFVALDGMVYLYAADPNGMYQLVDSTQIEQIQGGIFNAYYFDNVSLGTYIVKAVASAANSSTDFVPTYHLDALTWQDASSIEISANNSFGYGLIIIQESDDVNGPGSVSGLITGDANLNMGSSRFSDGLDGVSLILTMEDGTPIKHLYSDVDGTFSFEDLPYGTYRIYVDYLNINGSYILVTISADEVDITLNIIMENGSMYLSASEIPELNEVRLYPNPVKDFLQIEHENGSFKILEIIDMSGKVHIQTRHIETTTDKIRVDTRSLDDGIYIVRLLGEHGLNSSKFVKIRN